MTKDIYHSIKVKSITGRYITNQDLELAMKNFGWSNLKPIGTSVGQLPIYGGEIGTGPIKVLLWSQMHGNESTTTKALIDVLRLFSDNKDEAVVKLKEQLRLYVIPILNPDGAVAYTRVNKNNIDLNRDAQQLSQPESQLLHAVYSEFKPDFCFNLHGQRTIFGAGDKGHRASASFLSPAVDQERSVTNTRKKSMNVVNAINACLQRFIPNNVGRYDDHFNLDCVGDQFQSWGTPTVLFEAGHIKNDYQREMSRFIMFLAITEGLKAACSGDVENYKSYFDIPQNTKTFYDIIIRNAKFDSQEEDSVDVAIQYDEVLSHGSVNFIPKVVKIGALNDVFGHLEINANHGFVQTQDKKPLFEGNEIDFVLVNNDKIALKP